MFAFSFSFPSFSLPVFFPLAMSSLAFLLVAFTVTASFSFFFLLVPFALATDLSFLRFLVSFSMATSLFFLFVFCQQGHRHVGVRQRGIRLRLVGRCVTRHRSPQRQQCDRGQRSAPA